MIKCSPRHYEATDNSGGAGPRAVLVDRFSYPGTIYRPQAIDRLKEAFNLLGSGLDGATFLDKVDEFSSTEVLLGTWGLPQLSADLLDQLPELKAVFYGAGEYRHLYTEACQDRGITFCSGIEINSSYVAYHVFSSIVLALKGAIPLRDHVRRTRDWEGFTAPLGIYEAKIGLVGLGRIGKEVARLLHALPVKVLAHDRLLPMSEVVGVGCLPASLQEIFATCDVVSLHLPENSSTSGLIDRALLSSMREQSILLNTSRGSVIKQSELVQVLRERPDLTAYLDVCEPEPPEPSEPLFELENCYLTPHLSGAIGHERVHLGDEMVEEAIRWKQGKDLQHCVSANLQGLNASRRQVAAL